MPMIDNYLPVCSSHAEFGNTFADFFYESDCNHQISVQAIKFVTHCHHRGVQMSFSVDPSVIKNLKILNSMKKTTCHLYKCKIHFFMVFIGVVLRTWIQILRKSLFNGSFLQLWKKAVIRLHIL